MWKTTITVAVALCLAQTARGENLRIVGEAVRVADSESSCWVTLGIENTGAQERLLVWQLVFQIVPVGGPNGTVVIKDFAKPTAYVFGEASYDIGRSNESPIGPLFMGVSSDVAGADVLSSGMNLLRLEVASQGASGRFDLVAVPDNEIGTGSNWVSADLTVQDFAVVPVSDRPGTRVVASVEFVSTPEPSSSLMLLSAAAIMALPWVACRKRALGPAIRCLPGGAGD